MLEREQKKGIVAYYHVCKWRDEMNSSMNVVQTYQGGMRMGERDYYLENDEQTKNIRNEYPDTYRQNVPVGRV